MATPLVSDDLWAVVAPRLPPAPPKPQGGRPRLPERAALTGSIVVLKSDIPWELRPPELGCGRGVTCWRRWVIARTLSGLTRSRRLTRRDERRADSQHAFLTLGGALIWWNSLACPVLTGALRPATHLGHAR